MLRLSTSGRTIRCAAVRYSISSPILHIIFMTFYRPCTPKRIGFHARSTFNIIKRGILKCLCLMPPSIESFNLPSKSLSFSNFFVHFAFEMPDLSSTSDSQVPQLLAVYRRYCFIPSDDCIETSVLFSSLPKSHQGSRLPRSINYSRPHEQWSWNRSRLSNATKEFFSTSDTSLKQSTYLFVALIYFTAKRSHKPTRNVALWVPTSLELCSTPAHQAYNQEVLWIFKSVTLSLRPLNLTHLSYLKH